MLEVGNRPTTPQLPSNKASMYPKQSFLRVHWEVKADNLGKFMVKSSTDAQWIQAHLVQRASPGHGHKDGSEETDALRHSPPELNLESDGVSIFGAGSLFLGINVSQGQNSSSRDSLACQKAIKRLYKRSFDHSSCVHRSMVSLHPDFWT